MSGRLSIVILILQKRHIVLFLLFSINILFFINEYVYFLVNVIYYNMLLVIKYYINDIGTVLTKLTSQSTTCCCRWYLSCVTILKC